MHAGRPGFEIIILTNYQDLCNFVKIFLQNEKDKRSLNPYIRSVTVR